MKIFTRLWLFALICPMVALGGEPVVGMLSKDLQGKIRSLNPEYLVFSPAGDPKTRVPLLIYLHGAGGVGEEIRKISGQASAVWKGIEKFDKGPCIVVAPQCSKGGKEGGGWIPGDLNLLLGHLKATLEVDEKRIYLTGNSMGGYGTWVWAGNHPEHFAAVAPVSGGIGRGGPKEVTPKLKKWVENLAKIPVYAFVGAKDKVVPADRSESVIAAIRKAGGKQAKLKIYPNEGHGARGVVYSTAEFYEWLFSKPDADDAAGSGAEKITFDLAILDADGLGGPPDGKVAVDYEFCIPDTAPAKAEVERIDPSVHFSHSRGRIGREDGELLCLGNTHQKNHLEILKRLAELSYVRRIDRCFWE